MTACERFSTPPSLASDPIDDIFAPPFGLPVPCPPPPVDDEQPEDDGENKRFPDRLCNEASDLVAWLVAEKTRLLYAPKHETMSERCARLTRLLRVRQAIDRAAARLGRRRIAGVGPAIPPLNLWGPPNPRCPDCDIRHDPILNCPGRREAGDVADERPATALLSPKCANCDGPHAIQRCPEVWRALMG